MTPEQLAASTGANVARAKLWLTPIVDAMHEYSIDNPARQAAFLAQIGHETMGLVYAKEIWGPTKAQIGYEGRADLGNVLPGDGSRYRGRGLLQITGRANYAKAGQALGLDLIGHPEILEEREMAADVSAWWWQAHGLNELADAGAFDLITRRINGGQNGAAERRALWAKAKAALGVEQPA